MLVISRLFAQSFAVGAGLLGTGSSTDAIGRARRMFHAERHYMISTRMKSFWEHRLLEWPERCLSDVRGPLVN
jgi:hypothetical protein